MARILLNVQFEQRLDPKGANTYRNKRRNEKEFPKKELNNFNI